MGRLVALEPTVDEVLAEQGSTLAQAVKDDTESSEPSNSGAVSDSDAPRPELVLVEDSELAKVLDPLNNKGDDASLDLLDLMTPIARENWATIKDLFTDKKFPPPHPGPLKDLMSLRRVREIELNPLAVSKFRIHWPKDVSLLIVQLVGPESPKSCSRCEKGCGPFSSCVLVSQEVANALQGGICACVNCSWKSANQKSCDLRRLMKVVGAATGADGTPLRKAVLDSLSQPPRLDASGDSDSHSDSDQPLRARRSNRPLLSNTMEDSDSDQPLQVHRLGRLLRSDASGANTQLQRTINHRIPSTKVATSRVQATPSIDVEAVDTGTPDAVAVRKMKYATTVDDSFSFCVDVISPETTLEIPSDSGKLRICSLATGKVVVKVPDEPTFYIGFQGMFKLVPGARAEVRNVTGIDAVLHTSTFTGK